MEGEEYLLYSGNILVWVCQTHVQLAILKRTSFNPRAECGKRLKYIATGFICQRLGKDKFETATIYMFGLLEKLYLTDSMKN